MYTFGDLTHEEFMKIEIGTVRDLEKYIHSDKFAKKVAKLVQEIIKKEAVEKKKTRVDTLDRLKIAEKYLKKNEALYNDYMEEWMDKAEKKYNK